MKALFVVMLVTLGGAAGAWHFFLSPEARHERLAIRLIRTLRLDEAELGLIGNIFDRSLAKGNVTRQQHDCIVDASRAEIARMQSRGVSAYLSESELRKALAYYESTAGQKILQYLHHEAKRREPEYPIEVSGGSPEFDIDDMEQIVDFGRTPTGAKVSDIVSVMDQTVDDMSGFIRDRKLECGVSAS